MRRIKIATEYSETPVGRFPEDGEFNGTRFREDFLRPALSNEDKVQVYIDGVEGYGSSFLEEAFGGLVRKGYFRVADLKKKLEISYDDKDFEMYKHLVWKYINEASAEVGT